MDRPQYQIELSIEDKVAINKALRWYKERVVSHREEDVYQATADRNQVILPKIQLGVIDLDASEIGYIKMCLVEYARSIAKEQEYTVRIGLFTGHQDVFDKLDKAVDPKLERAYNRGRFYPGNQAATKPEAEQAKPEAFRFYPEDRANLASLLEAGYADDKTAIVRRALAEAVARIRGIE